MAKKKGQDQHQHAPAISDPRFARLQTDPRFLRPNREDAKVVIDDRFKSLLAPSASSKKGKGGPKTDKYGRKTGKEVRKREEEEMRQLYRLDKEDDEEDEEDDEADESETEQGKGFIDYARGEGVLESSSEEDSSSQDDDDDDDEEDEDEDQAEPVVIGSSAARRRERERLAAQEDEEDDEEGEEVDEDDGEYSDLDEDALAKLDAQAERTVAREEASTSKSKAKATPKRIGDTRRLAIVNMDWDHIRARDLYKVFSSLISPAATRLPGQSTSSLALEESVPRRKNRNGTEAAAQIAPVRGRIERVRIYPSNFGRERMAKEDREGPPKDIFLDESSESKSKRKKKKSKKREDSEDEEDADLFDIDDGGEFDEEALRNYQLERLRYFYAIATFDSPQTARHVLDEIDGTEMERTANVFDLSFVPDDMDFPEKAASSQDPSDEGWRDEATELSDGANYKGVDFTTDALRHSRVKLTWDADDPERSKVTRQLAQKALTSDEIRDEDFKAYLASGSEDSGESQDEDDEEEREGPAGGGGQRDKFRALLGLGKEEEKHNGTANRRGKTSSSAFMDGRKGRAEEEAGEGDMQITFMPGLSEAAARRQKGGSAGTEGEETTLEKYMRKQREKKERRKKGTDKEDDEPVDRMEPQAAGEKITFDDPFFQEQDEGEIDFEAALREEQAKESKKDKTNGKKSSKDLRDAKEDEREEARRMREELQLMVDSDSEGEGAVERSGRGHFSMADVLKAEKEGQREKKSRWAKKKEAKEARKGLATDDGKRQPQDGFELNVQDPRFEGVFKDHRFALDPSHPSFIKTKNMDKLLEEKRKRQAKRSGTAEEDRVPPLERANGKNKDRGSNNDLQDLVQSIKKRASADPSTAAAGKKKRARV